MILNIGLPIFPTSTHLRRLVFIVGMWFMAIKKIENWIFWIIGDVISIPLYAYKGLVFTSFQFVVFLVLAFAGYFAWKKKLACKYLNDQTNRHNRSGKHR